MSICERGHGKDTALDGEPSRDRALLTVRSAADLAQARATVLKCATAANIAPDRAYKIALAVSEIATNALVHAASSARLEIVTSTRLLMVRVSDNGPGLPVAPAETLPAPDQEHGRGLWLAEQYCDRVEIAFDANGAHVSLCLFR